MKSHNVLSTEKNDSFPQKFQNGNDHVFERNSYSNEDLFQWSDDESNIKDRSVLAHLNVNDSILDLFPEKDSTSVHRMLHAPGDILGQIDLLNGQKYTETCKCVTNTLVKCKNKQKNLTMSEILLDLVFKVE